MAYHKGERLLLWATTVAYLLITLEVLFMITPFALYFYGVYGPLLERLASNRFTAWSTEFFLPHMVFVITSYSIHYTKLYESAWYSSRRDSRLNRGVSGKVRMPETKNRITTRA